MNFHNKIFDSINLNENRCCLLSLAGFSGRRHWLLVPIKLLKYPDKTSFEILLILFFKQILQLTTDTYTGYGSTAIRLFS